MAASRAGGERSPWRRRIEIVRAQERPIRFLASRALMRSGLSRWLTIRRPGFRLRFHPSTMAAAYWIAPDERVGDERFVERALAPGETYVDVGANIGALVGVAAVRVGPTGHVVAVEPHPRVHGYLCENVVENGFGQVTTVNCALGEREGTARFSDLAHDDLNGIVRDGPGIEVPVRRLDDVDTGAGPIALLKVDVEGYERFVFAGAPRTLARTAVVFYESFEANFRPHGYGTGDVVRMLVAAGFRVLRFTGAEALAPIDASHVSTVCENLVAVRDVDAFLARSGYSMEAR
jgi:FkbM family methyltransferase